ncbi:hypothetical protein [Formosa haliotis]|uniref:hypothetical protein n=1 Tax=Formosa haliotis TaxID=1555194 RepID=UPI000825DF42|nr:hypothetical protein [Formosa haliotis]
MKLANVIIVLILCLCFGCKDKPENKEVIDFIKDIDITHGIADDELDTSRKQPIFNVDVSLNGKKVDFTQLSTKENVVFMDAGLNIKLVNKNKNVCMLNFISDDLYTTIPNSFTFQSVNLPMNQQLISERKRSHIQVYIPETNTNKDVKILYTGEAIIQKLTEDEIEITFQGKARTPGETEPEKLYDFEGHINIQDYNIYDIRHNK